MELKALSAVAEITLREFRDGLSPSPSTRRTQRSEGNPLLGCSNCCEFTHETAQFHARNTFRIIRIVQELAAPHAYPKWST